jgi:conjugative transposon TraM protein
MAFWALGGGQTSGEGNQLKQHTGLNIQLPDALLKEDGNENKLSFYKEADADSLKRKEILSNDPAYRNSLDTNIESMGFRKNSFNPLPPEEKNSNTSYKIQADNDEQRIYSKINEINKKINQPDKMTSSYPVPENKMKQDDSEGQFSNEIDRLHGMMQLMSSPETEDPEMQKLNNTLDKILDIQNPQRVSNRLKEKSIQNKEQVFIVSKNQPNQHISLLDTIKIKHTPLNNFYSLEDNVSQEDQNAIEAVIHETQTLMNGSVVKCRLMDDIYVNGTLIPRGNFIFGIAELKDDRLEISITSIRIKQSVYPIKLEVFDMDGLPGIYIPGAISRDVAKQATDNGLQSMDFLTMDPSLKAQATATGINAAKSFFSKKAKQVKVMVKAGYKILLRDKNV